MSEDSPKSQPPLTPGWTDALAGRSGMILAGVLLAQAIAHAFLLSFSAHFGPVTVPWLMNHGRTLFGDILDQHAPGGFVAAALAQRILPFEPVVTARLMNLLLAMAVSVLVYALARRLLNELAAVAAVLTWALWEPVYGNIVFYFDDMVGSLILLAAVLWLGLEKRERQWAAILSVGVVLGGATTVKQHGWVAVVLFALWMVVFHSRSRARRSNVARDLGIYAVGVLALPLLALIVIAAQGNLGEYIYWNWTYNFEGLVPGKPLTGNFLRKLLLANVFVPAFALLALRDSARRATWTLALVMWLGGSATLFPRLGEIHVMGQLPLVAVMSGVVIATVLDTFGKQSPRAWLQQAGASELVLAGVLPVVLVGWAWTCAAPYGSNALGRGRTFGYTEFEPLAARLRELSEPGDTLAILPELDGTAQLRVMSDMLPPGTWVNTWPWYLRAADVVERLLAEWEERPPDYVVLFPQYVAPAQPYIDPLVDFTLKRYELVTGVDSVMLHGEARVYRLIK